MRRIEVTRFMALLFVLSLGAGETRAEYAMAQKLWEFAPPLAGERRQRTSLSAAGDTIWLLHPDGHISRRQARSDGKPKGVRTVTHLRTELPFQPESEQLELLAVSDSMVWLVDATHRRVWVLKGEEWSGPWALGEPIGAIAATGDRLIVNTPAHPSHAFAVFGVDGELKQRLGARLTPPRQGLDQEWNRWTIAVLSDGRLISAHRYSALTRVHSPTGELIREWTAPAPAANGLLEAAAAALAAIRVDPATCCWEARLPLFATRILPLPGGEFAIQYGSAAALEEFDSSLRWVRSSPIRVSSPLLELAAADKAIVAVTAHDVIILSKGPSHALRGVVTSAARKPLSGATLIASAASGSTARAETDPAGRFALFSQNPDEVHQLTVTAPGFRRIERKGRLREIVRDPILLPPLLRQCVEVLDATTDQPLDSFEVTLAREIQQGGRREQTQSRHSFSGAEGKACIDSAFDPPWLTQVASKGYAPDIAEITARAVDATHVVRLTRGAVLEVVAREVTGAPAEGIELLLVPADRHAIVAVNVEHTARTDPEGRARFDGLVAGTLTLEGASDRHVPFSREIRITSAFQVEDIEVATGAVLRVKVQSTEGAIEGAVVAIDPLRSQPRRPLQCRTDAEGNCSIPALAPGRYEVHARAEGFGAGFRPVDIGTTDREVEVHLTGVVRLTGTVENRHEYSDLELEVFASRPGFAPVSAPVDSAGAFTLETAPSGTINIRIWERNRNSGLILQQITVPHGRASHHVTLRLPPAAAISGRVRHQGRGCGECGVTFRRAGAEVDVAVIRGRMDSSGAYLARVPGEGTYVIRAEAPDGTFEQRIADIHRAAVHDFDLESGRIRVSVRDTRGNHVAAARVQAIDADRGITLADMVTDERGVASLASFEGATRITAAKDRATGFLIHPGRGGNTAVEITLREASGIAIDVRDPGGLPLPRVTARLRSRRTGLDTGPIELVRHNDAPFEVGVDSNDTFDIIVQAPRLAPRTEHGLTGPGPHRILVRGGITVAVRVAPGITPCRLQFLDSRGWPYGLSTAYPLAPIPFTIREAVFNPVEAAEYTVVLHTCPGEVLRRSVTVAPGTVTSLVSFD